MTLTLRAKVRSGRLLLDEPSDLPEGAEVELVAVREGDGLGAEDLRRLHEQLTGSEAEIRRGELFDADEVVSSLRT